MTVSEDVGGIKGAEAEVARIMVRDEDVEADTGAQMNSGA
ncbi:hypothetical protein ACVIKO_007119 [Rhizobium ruizarguesonis]|jgi:hypothetical protein